MHLPFPSFLSEASTYQTDKDSLPSPRLNSSVIVDAYEESIHSLNAEKILSLYDIILDCTDNAPTRYLLSDVAVRLGKPLVSGAAQKFDGQLCTYNLPLPNGAGQGPCYRCLFPKPPAPEMAGSCEETGIIGAVTGVIGTLQAMETIKILTGIHGKPFHNDHFLIKNE